MQECLHVLCSWCVRDEQQVRTSQLRACSLHWPFSVRARLRTMLKAQSVQAALTSAARPEQLSAFSNTATQNRVVTKALLIISVLFFGWESYSSHL